MQQVVMGLIGGRCSELDFRSQFVAWEKKKKAYSSFFAATTIMSTSESVLSALQR